MFRVLKAQYSHHQPEAACVCNPLNAGLGAQIGQVSGFVLRLRADSLTAYPGGSCDERIQARRSKLKPCQKASVSAYPT